MTNAATFPQVRFVDGSTVMSHRCCNLSLWRCSGSAAAAGDVPGLRLGGSAETPRLRLCRCVLQRGSLPRPATLSTLAPTAAAATQSFLQHSAARPCLSLCARVPSRLPACLQSPRCTACRRGRRALLAAPPLTTACCSTSCCWRLAARPRARRCSGRPPWGRLPWCSWEVRGRGVVAGRQPAPSSLPACDPTAHAPLASTAHTMLAQPPRPNLQRAPAMRR